VGNLLANAIKYTPDGGRIEVRARRGDGSVLIQVEDNGPGISPEDQQRLFEEFVRIRSSAGRSRGSGLGLSIVKRAAKVHCGEARVDSELGEGSTFTLELPLTTEGSL
jgi:two-component system sensor histidine kinase SenX3